MSVEILACQYAGVCGGCSIIQLPYAEQKELKLNELQKFWDQNVTTGNPFAKNQVNWIYVGAGGLRDRADLVYQESAEQNPSQRLGMYSVPQESGTDLVDLQVCAQMSKPLDILYQKLRSILGGVLIGVKKGSLRLRTGFDGEAGIWIDFSNEDIKRLLDEQKFLRQLMQIASVEIGQKRKTLQDVNGQLKLQDPVLRPWFSTVVADQSVPLYCSIGDFTQPSMRANEDLVRAVTEPLKKAGVRQGIEFGSGCGNFTLPLASFSEHVAAFEIEKRSAATLLYNLEKVNLDGRVKIHQGNFHKDQSMENFPWENYDYVVVDPPRSGLQGFLQPLFEYNGRKPKHFVYVSCFAESFAADVSRLLRLGYQVESLSVVDQFPQSRHYEIICKLAYLSAFSGLIFSTILGFQ